MVIMQRGDADDGGDDRDDVDGDGGVRTTVRMGTGDGQAVMGARWGGDGMDGM